MKQGLSTLHLCIAPPTAALTAPTAAAAAQALQAVALTLLFPATAGLHSTFSLWKNCHRRSYHHHHHHRHHYYHQHHHHLQAGAPPSGSLRQCVSGPLCASLPFCCPRPSYSCGRRRRTQRQPCSTTRELPGALHGYSSAPVLVPEGAGEGFKVPYCILMWQMTLHSQTAMFYYT